MNYFYIDTSSSFLYSGIVSKGNLISSIKQNFNKGLSKYTVSEVQKLFIDADMKPTNIDKIIVVSGPGSFTGIRIGMTFAKIFAWSLNKKITTITSLEAMSSSINSNKVLVPLIDARRGYVYAGVYKCGKSILKDQYIALDKLENFLNELGEDYCYITNDKEFNFSNKFGYNPDILKIVNTYKDKIDINPHLVEPVYLKLTEAEENLGSISYDN